MNPAMIAFFFGVVVGGLGGTLLIGLLFLVRARENQEEEIQGIENSFSCPSFPETETRRHWRGAGI